MRVVATQAIAREPLRATVRGVWRFFDFWRSVYSPRMAFVQGDDQTDVTTAGPPPWSHPACQRLRDAWLNSAPERRLLIIELTSLIAVLGLFGMCCDPRTWRIGIILTTTVALIAISTAALELPTYRYRMVIEPLLIVATVCGVRTIVEVLRRGIRSLWDSARSPQ
jgi:hypothetical protein